MTYCLQESLPVGCIRPTFVLRRWGRWWDVVLGGLVPGKVWPVDRMTGACENITFPQSRKFLNFLRHVNDVVSPVWALNACLHGATTIPIKFVFGRNYLYRVAHSTQISRRRMHSSRMLTARSLLYGGCLRPGSLCPEGGFLSREGNLCPGGSLSRDNLCPGGPLSRGSLCPGGSLPRGSP